MRVTRATCSERPGSPAFIYRVAFSAGVRWTIIHPKGRVSMERTGAYGEEMPGRLGVHMKLNSIGIVTEGYNWDNYARSAIDKGVVRIATKCKGRLIGEELPIGGTYSIPLADAFTHQVGGGRQVLESAYFEQPLKLNPRRFAVEVEVPFPIGHPGADICVVLGAYPT